ncbi:Extracellular esterase EstB precursor [Nocardioides dokdonensis FR1436]|uniref:Extracellular esterase EstB n=1 Tax=Nocardioides dokdonensis FR1436 TaxID=1300347 RepID=A0A1A9GJ12_9ACTN|nr:alpha/beta fold hydrolase [Nocardioides dokdonensis]ANH38224.1 Extracellular esterase EstB precursor [Nocardioides dokdonensis FR1436]
MRRTRSTLLALVATLGLVLGLVLGGVGASTAGAAEKYPVPYNFLPSAIAGGLQSDAPGTNDWDCRPSKRHPRPVVLVHGTFGNQSTNWQTYGPLLANKGYCVFALTYGTEPALGPGSGYVGGLGKMQRSARELKAFVAEVRAATGARKVDLLGHSQGTLMPAWYLKFLGGATHVKRYVSLAPLWHGTQVAGAAAITAAVFGVPVDKAVPLCVACGQFSPDSTFLRRVRAGGVAQKGVRYTNIMTEYDQLVVPYTSGREKGMRNIVVQDGCDTDYTEHFQIAADPVAAGHVLNALDPQHRKPVTCQLVLPFVGGPPQP